MRTRIAVKYAAGTDVGLVRQHNEDAYLASGPVFLVADARQATSLPPPPWQPSPS